MTAWISDVRAKVIAAAGAAAGRVFVTKRDQDKGLPAVVLHIISGPRGYTMEGPQGLNMSRVQVDCLADDPAEAYALAIAVQAGIPVTWATQSNRFDKVSTDDPTTDGDQNETEYVHRAKFDAMVWHAPTAG